MERLGRVKTAAIKKFSKSIYQKNKSKFTSDFQKNKKILEELVSIESKKIKNQVVGYITRLVKIPSTAKLESEIEEPEKV